MALVPMYKRWLPFLMNEDERVVHHYSRQLGEAQIPTEELAMGIGDSKPIERVREATQRLMDQGRVPRT